MSVARQVLPQTTYLLTRRCTQRQFLLRPSETVNDIFRYVLAVAQARFDVEIHALCVMSNHWHAVVTDQHGNIPEFIEFVHKFTAKAINASMGRWENLWASEKTSLIPLHSSEDIVNKAVYTLTNPVAAGLVGESKAWPGLLLGSGDWSKRLQVERPAIFFREEGTMPKLAHLKLTAPTGAGERVTAQNIADQVKITEATIRAEFARNKRSFLGKQAVLAQRPQDKPKSREPRRKLNPRAAGANKWLRIEAIVRMKDFLNDYAEAFAKWRSGLKKVLFPPGTYALARRAPVEVHPHENLVLA